ncbi:nucleotidyltransferase domain-containing protein [Candidatus Haliotispira prima]|uniref:Nucleotidyltransferase domain-containing protein n=1 Tax=Candidatus Haliotispira prima TaxID=3034016 RepID=A0ABY8MI95_9SPIO|nr:nucleotidyltransferase domain-containing protein [Candidatus Haliotispira prima]
MNKYGLFPKEMQIIKEVLLPYKEKIDQIALFGSRAMGTYKEGSDIDLVLYGELTEKEERRIGSEFQESSLVLNLDIKVYHLIGHKPLQEHIDKIKAVLDLNTAK